MFFSLALMSTSTYHRQTYRWVRQGSTLVSKLQFYSKSYFFLPNNGFNSIRAVLTCAILEKTSVSESLSAPMYLKVHVTLPTFCCFKYLDLPLGAMRLFVTSFIFSALISSLLCRFCGYFSLGLFDHAFIQEHRYRWQSTHC